MSRSWLPIALLLLAGCSSPTPHYAMARVNTEFQGRPAHEFFLDYGQPASVRHLRGGGTSYRWLSLDAASGTSASVIVSPASHYALGGDETNGEMFTGYCEIRVEANRDDVITRIVPVNDSIGKFSDSRCAEIFGQK